MEFAADVSTSVELPDRPTRDEAEGILFTLASAELDHRRGDAGDLQFTAVEVDGSPA